MKRFFILCLLCAVAFGCDKDVHPSAKAQIFAAVERGDAVFLRKYLAGGGDPDLYFSVKGYLLANAILSDNIEVLELLISRGADVNRKKADESGPLLQAVLFKRCEQAKLLLSAGADLNERYVNYWRAAMPPELKDRTIRDIYFYNKQVHPAALKRKENCWKEWEALIHKQA